MRTRSLSILVILSVLALTSSAHSLQKKATVLMEEMSWTEIRDAIAEGKTTVLLVAGSIEQHGPHLPTMADSLVGKYLAEQAAIKLGNALVAPVLQPGLAEHHMAFPGTLTVYFDQFTTLLTEYCRSLANSGFSDIVIISSHGGNTDAIIAYAPRIAKQLENQANVHVATAANSAEDARRRQQVAAKYGLSLGKAGVHAGWFETSMVLAVRPDLVDMSKAERGFDDDDFYAPDNAKRNQMRGFVLGVKPYAANGILGDPRGASAEAGRALLELATEQIVNSTRLLTAKP